MQGPEYPAGSSCKGWRRGGLSLQDLQSGCALHARTWDWVVGLAMCASPGAGHLQQIRWPVVSAESSCLDAPLPAPCSRFLKALPATLRHAFRGALSRQRGPQLRAALQNLWPKRRRPPSSQLSAVWGFLFFLAKGLQGISHWWLLLHLQMSCSSPGRLSRCSQGHTCCAHVLPDTQLNTRIPALGQVACQEPGYPRVAGSCLLGRGSCSTLALFSLHAGLGAWDSAFACPRCNHAADQVSCWSRVGSIPLPNTADPVSTSMPLFQSVNKLLCHRMPGWGHS